MKEVVPNFIAEVTVYPTDRGGRASPIVRDWFGCPCKFHERDFTAWDCRILTRGERFGPGETKRFGIVFLSPEIAPAFRSVKKFYLWEGRIIGEAMAADEVVKALTSSDGNAKVELPLPSAPLPEPTAQAANRQTHPKFVGPHEGRELELMAARQKPLSMFVEPIDSEFEYFPEEKFDSLIAKGELVKRVSVERIIDPTGKPSQVRRVLYALPKEAWRMDAVLLVQELYDSLSPGWRPDLERLIGHLLGYERVDVEAYVKLMATRNKDGGNLCEGFLEAMTATGGPV